MREWLSTGVLRVGRLPAVLTRSIVLTLPLALVITVFLLGTVITATNGVAMKPQHLPLWLCLAPGGFIVSLSMPLLWRTIKAVPAAIGTVAKAIQIVGAMALFLVACFGFIVFVFSAIAVAAGWHIPWITYDEKPGFTIIVGLGAIFFIFMILGAIKERESPANMMRGWQQRQRSELADRLRAETYNMSPREADEAIQRGLNELGPPY
jgi:hypothetical protein